MERNYGAEIDALKKELQEIKALLTKEVSEPSAKKIGHVEKMVDMPHDPSIMAIMDKLENSCSESGDSGRITYLGVFASGENQSFWVRNGINTDDLLGLIENKTAEKVLACIGNSDRLNILLAVLKKPMTVAQLVKECGYNSMGQVYHHLKPLLAADLLTDDECRKGHYRVQPHRVQGIIMLLAGISDLIDTQYSQGEW